jgi:hypothetical protein
VIVAYPARGPGSWGFRLAVVGGVLLLALGVAGAVELCGAGGRWRAVVSAEAILVVAGSRS